MRVKMETTYDESIDLLDAILGIDMFMYSVDKKKSGVTKKRLLAYITVLKDLKRRQQEERDEQ